MTLEQLERRVTDLERELAEVRSELKSMRPFSSVEETFGLFANDPGFDEMVRLGREYRDKVNAEGSKRSTCASSKQCETE
jgi:hypothetical protein